MGATEIVLIVGAVSAGVVAIIAAIKRKNNKGGKHHGGKD